MAIAIVDDSVTNLAILKHLSAKLGIKDILSFSDPEVALGHLGRSQVDLVVVDYEMPKKNGLQFIAALRASHGPNHQTPIIMVTAVAARDVRLKALNSGATDFLNKPVDPAEFRARISNLLRLKAVPQFG